MELHAIRVHALVININSDTLAGLRASEMMRRVSEPLLEVAHDDHGFARARAVDPRLDDTNIIFLHLAERCRNVLVEGLERGHDAERGVARRPRAAGVDGHEHGGLALAEEDILAGQDAERVQANSFADRLWLDTRRSGFRPHEPHLSRMHAHEISEGTAEKS